MLVVLVTKSDVMRKLAISSIAVVVTIANIYAPSHGQMEGMRKISLIDINKLLLIKVN